MSVAQPPPIAATGTGAHGLAIARVAATLAALLAGAVVTVIMLTNEVRQPLPLDLIFVPLVGWSFAVVSGLVAWSIREDNRIGPAMVATGLLWFASALYWSQDPVVFSVGHAFESFYLAGIVYVLVAFPTGRLDTGLSRLLAVVVFLAAGPAEILFLVLGGHAVSSTCAGCPAFVFQIASAADLARGVQVVQHGAGLVALTLSVGILVSRWRAASPPLRACDRPGHRDGHRGASGLCPVGGQRGAWWTRRAPRRPRARPDSHRDRPELPGGHHPNTSRAFGGRRLDARDWRRPSPGVLQAALARALRDRSLAIAVLAAGARALRRLGRPVRRAPRRLGRTRGHDDRA